MKSTDEYVQEHRIRVKKRILDFVHELYYRMHSHDMSKLEEPEYSLWKEMDKEPRYPYGTPEYIDKINRHKKVFELHYMHNTHHPEHYYNGISDMDLVDLIEMLIDWISYKDEISIKEAVELIETQSERYNMSEDLKSIMKNTLFRHYSRMKSLLQNTDKFIDSDEKEHLIDFKI